MSDETPDEVGPGATDVPSSPDDDRPLTERTALVDRPRVKTFLAVAGFVVAVTGLAVAVWVNFLRTAPGSATRADPSATSTVSASQPSGVSGSPIVGQCFSAEWGETGCDTRHHWQVIALGAPCSIEQALAFLGGVPGVDVLALDAVPVVHPLGGHDACVLGLPGGAALTSSVRDVLQTPAGDVWRRCIDDRVAREVACSIPHTAEVVGPPAAGDLNCPAQADRYAETSLSKFSLDLAVSSRGPEGHEQCVVAVRGENVLTRSLRHLGSESLPIQSD